MSRIVDDYLSWIFDFVDSKMASRYSKLLYKLYDTPFYWSIPMDDNRASDGVNLRYRFAIENDIPYGKVTSELDMRDCSVLEMLVALSIRCEAIMERPDEDRTAKWFWKMSDNLGLYDMTNVNLDNKKVEMVIDRFLSRSYKANGRGGLFPTKRKVDLREVDIWCQMCWYLDDYIKIERN